MYLYLKILLLYYLDVNVTTKTATHQSDEWLFSVTAIGGYIYG